jgi:cob(I)alamin adenosyltransferase
MGKVYTRFGDGGETRLFDSTRVRKDHVRVDAYGEVDELNATLGAAAAFIDDREMSGYLFELQKQLLALGAQLADPRYKDRSSDKGKLDPAWVELMERIIDSYDDELPKLQNFILSGGGPGGALLHVSRTVCRRAERSAVGLAETTELEPGVIKYLNRLSDLLFVLARVVNHREGREEVQW